MSTVRTWGSTPTASDQINGRIIWVAAPTGSTAGLETTTIFVRRIWLGSDCIRAGDDMVVVAPIEEMRISSENDLVEFLRTIAENTEWKGESRVITLVVALSLLGAPEELDQVRIDFFEKSIPF